MPETYDEVEEAVQQSKTPLRTSIWRRKHYGSSRKNDAFVSSIRWVLVLGGISISPLLVYSYHFVIYLVESCQYNIQIH